ncbi:hypothetical protein [Adlercreutzia murintestinalis]|uniref:hypothetical protein n=1 Tax=Adlercreutzia murintestinalis TaxID=2941325 RepID=UPI00203A731A|nr:hypothetical protein [Adlercreutzia murintestinalis]
MNTPMNEQMNANMGAAARAKLEAQQRSKKRRRIVTIIVALIAIIIAALLSLYMCTDIDMPGRMRSGDAEFGQLDGKTEAEIQAELNRVVDESMFDISIAHTMIFPDGESEGEVRIENVPGNRYLLDCVITEDETGDVLYESGVLEPNHHITSAKLLKDLDPGTYQATALFHALDPDTEEEVGAVNAQVTIMVEG